VAHVEILGAPRPVEPLMMVDDLLSRASDVANAELAHVCGCNLIMKSFGISSVALKRSCDSQNTKTELNPGLPDPRPKPINFHFGFRRQSLLVGSHAS
jgi:hypothetical protein